MLSDLTAAHDRLTDAANGALEALERVNAAEAALAATMDAGLAALIAQINAITGDTTTESPNKEGAR